MSLKTILVCFCHFLFQNRQNIFFLWIIYLYLVNKNVFPAMFVFVRACLKITPSKIVYVVV